MGRGATNKSSALVYARRRPSREDLQARLSNRFRRHAEAVGVPDPPPAAVEALERLICDWEIPDGSPSPELGAYARSVEALLDEHTPSRPGTEVVTGAEARLDTLDRARVLLARASHRLPVEIRDQLLSAYAHSDLSGAAGFESIHVPLASLMKATPLEHRSWPTVLQRRLDPWGEGGVRRAPEGKYMTHFATGEDKALCGARVSRLGRTGKGLWGVVEDGTARVTCPRCQEAAGRRADEILMVTESSSDQLARLFVPIANRASDGAAEHLGDHPMKVDHLVAKVRGCAWDGVVAELESVCKEAGQRISYRTHQFLRHFPAEPDRIARVDDGAIPALPF